VGPSHPELDVAARMTAKGVDDRLAPVVNPA
jgi:hypothetical protein